MSQEKLQRPWYIVIEGAIGVGKTTLARMLSSHFDTELLLEVFEENPFLAKFYESRARYAFQTQMFFLLSRYRQQQQVLQYIGQRSLISDYVFDKDRLFAELNLVGDEWDIYQQIHTALARQIPTPDLIVYLQADTDVLMGRIALRDRPYERGMDLEYIESLRQAYERFFPSRTDLPVLYIDTNHLNFITSPADFHWIVERIRSMLKEGVFQQELPQLQTPLQERDNLVQGRRLADYQRFHVALDRAKGFDTNMYFNYICLSEEMGELGSVLAKLWREEATRVNAGEEGSNARQKALAQSREELESELADCMSYLLKLANYAGIDLEKAYLAKMHLNQKRSWR